MNKIVTVIGVTVLLLGLVNPFGFSILDTVKITSPKVTCNTTGACSVSFSFTNVNATSSFLVYMKVVNSQSQTVFLNYVQVAQGTAITPISGLPIGTSYKPGAYIFTAFAIDSQGRALSETASTAFNVGGNYQLTIFPTGSASGSITPSCPYTSPCSYPVGEKVAITYTPAANYRFAQWNVLNADSNQPFVSKDNPLLLTMDSNYELQVDVVAPNAQYFIVTPTISATGGRNENPVPGTISPLTDTKVYQDSAYGSTSITFTVTPNANYTFANWQTNDKNFTANPLALTYSDLKPLQTSGQTQFYLYAYFKANVFQQLGVGAYSGISTSPTARNTAYTYGDGEQVTVSVTSVADTVCFSGWIIDGNDMGDEKSITVTMDAYHHVYAQGFGKPSEGCGGGGGGGGGGQVNPSIPIAVLGGAITTAGFVLNRRKH